jgi:octaprenyl-diphosphate synthase
MHILQRYLQQELPPINDFLDRETEKLPALVRDVARHVLQAGGKRLRPLLTILFSRGSGPIASDVYPLACSMEFFHSATLLHDDILDDSHLRRGQTTAHLVFGKTETILAGDVLLALGNRLVAEYGDPRLSWRISEAIMRTATGEIQELTWLSDPVPSQSHYLEIITGKTAYLIQAACHCGTILSGDPALEQSALDYGLNLGIAFQLTDDALDYETRSEVAGKPVGSDLREGKLTLPLILYLEKVSETKQRDLLSEIRPERANPIREVSALSETRLAEIIAEVRNSGCVEQTRYRAAEYVQLASKALKNFPESEEREVLQEALTHTLQRDK